MKTEIEINGTVYPMYETMRYNVEMQRAGKLSAPLFKLKDPKKPLKNDNVESLDMELHLLSAYWLTKGACMREKVEFKFSYEQFIDQAPDDVVAKVYQARFGLVVKKADEQDSPAEDEQNTAKKKDS